ncbi:ABC transporter ATP-binding protein [Kribbella hippodromi]|uniref:ABC transporter ATP-binding protein n=1 Tax=Kribbella hippodromi TaxID=434347 RepID=A0ABN2EL40_9ACTN
MELVNASPDALRVRGLSVSFRIDGAQVDAVRHVDLDVPRGRLVALLGESGSGKSVTARAVMGLSGSAATVTADEINLAGTDLLTVDPQTLRGRRMSLVLQDALSALNPVLTIGDQVGELFRVHQGASRQTARNRAAELLGLVGIPAPVQRLADYPHQFSGGMRQRILIAMAIALEPELLIADEPTTALDVTVQAQILDLLADLRSQLDMGVLLITHDLAVVSEVADQLTVMYAGRVVETGDADVVLAHPSHPYTEALLRSVPQLEQHGGDLFTIPGSPPHPARVPHGCAFHPRCHRVVDQCSTVRPELLSIGGRGVACHQSEVLLGEQV